MNKLNVLIIIVLVAIIAWLGFSKINKKEEVPAPIVEEKSEKITYNNTDVDHIVVDLPFPGAVTGKEFKVMGKARAFYFEGSFPIDVLDSQGKILVQTYATAQGEWMVDAFVPFEANVKVPETYIGPATLVLHKDNASGLPEHDASMSFPFTIEY
jgi:hypothetical protein